MLLSSLQSATIRSLQIIAVCMLTGTHLLVFQSIAWVQMYHNYSKSLPSEIALELTFSGQEMCGLCEAVENARTSMSDGINAWIFEHPNFIFLRSPAIRANASPEHFLAARFCEQTSYFSSFIESIEPPPPKFMLG